MGGSKILERINCNYIAKCMHSELGLIFDETKKCLCNCAYPITQINFSIENGFRTETHNTRIIFSLLYPIIVYNNFIILS